MEIKIEDVTIGATSSLTQKYLHATIYISDLRQEVIEQLLSSLDIAAGGNQAELHIVYQKLLKSPLGGFGIDIELSKYMDQKKDQKNFLNSQRR